MVSTKISDRVYMVDTMALGQPETVAVYVLRGEKTALVDCGYASSYQTVLDGLVDLGVRPSEVDYLIPTHVHLDHGGGTGYLLREMPRARVFAQERGVPHLVDPTRLMESATMVFGEEMVNRYGRPAGVDPQRIEPVSEEMHLDLGGLSVTMVHSPGHAPHQLSVFVEEGKVLLTADAVGIVYPAVPTMIPTTTPPSLDPIQLGRTTEKLGQMDPKLLLVPHYGLREDADAVLETTKRKTFDWVEKVRSMDRAGAGPENIAETLMREVELEAGLGELPPYAQISVRISVNGILHYLRKSAQAKA